MPDLFTNYTVDAFLEKKTPSSHSFGDGMFMILVQQDVGQQLHDLEVVDSGWQFLFGQNHYTW